MEYRLNDNESERQHSTYQHYAISFRNDALPNAFIIFAWIQCEISATILTSMSLEMEEDFDETR